MLDLFGKLKEASDKFLRSKPTYLLKTGNIMIDTHNGGIVNDEIVSGVKPGSFLTVISQTGGGKSTSVVNMAKGIVHGLLKQSSYGHVIVVDAEKANRLTRIVQLQPQIPHKYIAHTDSNTTLEVFEDMVNNIHKIKLESGDQVEYRAIDVEGNFYTALDYTPTVVIIDSLQALVPEEQTDVDNDSNMSGARVAGINKRVFNRLAIKMHDANIIVMIINHITTNFATQGTIPKTLQMYLDNSEYVPGGKFIFFMSDYYLKYKTEYALSKNNIADSKASKSGSLLFNINGQVVMATVIKSRGFKGGVRFPMVIDYDKGGVSNFLSVVAFMKIRKLIVFAGSSSKFSEEMIGYNDNEPLPKGYTLKSISELHSETPHNELVKHPFVKSIFKAYNNFLMKSDYMNRMTKEDFEVSPIVEDDDS